VRLQLPSQVLTYHAAELDLAQPQVAVRVPHHLAVVTQLVLGAKGVDTWSRRLSVVFGITFAFCGRQT
jgi:hypothetical protein